MGRYIVERRLVQNLGVDGGGVANSSDAVDLPQIRYWMDAAEASENGIQNYALQGENLTVNDCNKKGR
jgi:hypothetical protein